MQKVFERGAFYNVVGDRLTKWAIATKKTIKTKHLCFEMHNN
jgi:hypothetical protein